MVRNNRPADVTEIGIKSRVFQTLNGLSNFMVVPSPEKLRQLDKDKVQITGGVINSTIERTSCFAIFVRRAGVDASGAEFEYERLAPLFAVTGSKPVDQYSLFGCSTLSSEIQVNMNLSLYLFQEQSFGS